MRWRVFDLNNFGRHCKSQTTILIACRSSRSTEKHFSVVLFWFYKLTNEWSCSVPSLVEIEDTSTGFIAVNRQDGSNLLDNALCWCWGHVSLFSTTAKFEEYFSDGEFDKFRHEKFKESQMKIYWNLHRNFTVIFKNFLRKMFKFLEIQTSISI